jgi:rhodanese-related sulfurtransferase
MHITRHFPSTAIIFAISLMAIFLSSVVARAIPPAATTNYSPLLISVKDAIEAKRNNPRTIFVDVRAEEAFQKIRIPDSINVPLHFVKTKGYLDNMSVILVNKGHTYNRLVFQAELLNQKGIETVVLAGGLAGWSQQKGNLAGPGSAESGMLHEVDPAALSLTEFTRYIDISPEKTAGDSPLLSNAEHAPITSLDDLPALAALIDAERQSPLARVLIFNQKGGYGLLENLPGKCRTTLFLLREGSDGYDKNLLQQQAILEPKSERMKTIGGCSTCPPVKNKTDQN